MKNISKSFSVQFKLPYFIFQIWYYSQIYAGTKEVQFEEIRAALYMKRKYPFFLCHILRLFFFSSDSQIGRFNLNEPNYVRCGLIFCDISIFRQRTK